MRIGWWGLLAAGLVAAGAIGVAYSHDMARARAATEGRSRLMESPFGPIEYVDAGDGPVVLLIHGSGGGFDQGLRFGAPLLGRGIRLIAPSRFGYLRSAMPAGATPEMQADALAYLMGRLGVEQAVIFGGSAGALSATQLALRHPTRCRGLVLGVPALYAPERVPDTNPSQNTVIRRAVAAALGSDFLFWAGVRLAPESLTRLILATDPAVVARASAAEQQRVRDVLFHILPISDRVQGLLMDGATAGAPPPYAFEAIGCPVLAISARDDLYGTDKAAAHVAARAPSARLVMYEDGGHLWAGHDDAVWREVTTFVRALDPPTVSLPASPSPAPRRAPP